MSTTESRNDLRYAMLGLLWGQWTELGVAGAHGSPGTIIDPEALLLATVSFARYDPRLFDEVLDWLVSFGTVLDVTRLRRLARPLNADNGRLAMAVVDLMRQRASASKWTPISERWRAQEARAAYAPTSLFLTADDSPLPVFGESDSFFAAQGFIRPPLELRGMSSPPSLEKPALLRLRARALTGLGVRAESLLYLWTHTAAHGRLIAERTGYSQRQVADYLSNLSAARFAERYDVGKTVQYRLGPALGGIVGRPVRYVDWPRAFDVIRELLAMATSASAQSDAYEASVMFRAGLEKLRPLLPAEGLDLRTPEPERHPATRIIDYAHEYLADAARQIRDLT